MKAKTFPCTVATVYANESDSKDRHAFNLEVRSGMLAANIWMTPEQARELRDTLNAAIAYRAWAEVAA